MRKLLMLILLPVLAGLLLAACGAQEPPSAGANPEREMLLLAQETTNVTVYYATIDGKYLVPLTFSVKATREAARVALEKLLAGAPNEFVKSPLSADVKLKDLYAQGDTVFVDLTKDYTQMDEGYARLASRALVATVLPLWDNSQMQMLLNGLPYEDIGALTLSQPLKEEPINAVKPIAQDAPYITYYFGDSQAMYLVPQTAPLPDASRADDTEYLAEQVVKALLAGPAKDSGLLSAINRQTKLLELSLENRIVTVNFSPKLLEYSGSSAEEMILLDSLLFSLTEIDGVDGVQLLIDGEKQEYLPGGSDISGPLKRVGQINAVQ